MRPMNSAHRRREQHMQRRNFMTGGTAGAAGLGLVAQQINGQQRRTAGRGQALSTTAWAKSRRSRMHDVMSGYVERGDLPGIVTLVSHRGEVHVDAIGRQSLGGADPMR